MNRDGRREGDEGAAQKETAGKTRRRRHTATKPPGLEHPGGRRGKRTSRRSPDCNIRARTALERSVQGCAKMRRRRRQEKRGASQGEHEQEQATDGRGQEEQDGRREGNEGVAQKETTGKARRKEKVGTVPRTGTTEARKKQHSSGAPWAGTSGGTQWQADKRTEPGLEHPGKKVPAGNRATRTGSSGGRSPGRGQLETKRVALERRVKDCAKRTRRRRREEREASQGEHELEQGTDGRGDEEREP